MKAIAKLAVLLSVTGVLFFSTRPVMAAETESAAAVDPTATAPTATLVNAVVVGAAAGAARGFVVALFGTPSIGAAVAVGAVSGAVAGAAASLTADLIDGPVTEAVPLPSTALD
jgi:uncharacterized membrane protein